MNFYDFDFFRDAAMGRVGTVTRVEWGGWEDEEKMKRNKKWGTIKRNKKEMKEEQNMSNKQVIFDL